MRKYKVTMVLDIETDDGVGSNTVRACLGPEEYRLSDPWIMDVIRTELIIEEKLSPKQRLDTVLKTYEEFPERCSVENMVKALRGIIDGMED